MSIKKIIQIQGTSQTSFNEAITDALCEASKSIYNINKIVIKNLSCNVIDNKISEYVADLNITFTVDLERINKWEK